MGPRAGRNGDTPGGTDDENGAVMLRCAVLDDYQGVALTSADWSTVGKMVEVAAFREHVNDENELVSTIRDFDIVVVMRERTPLPRSVFARLPRLRLVVTTRRTPARPAIGRVIARTARRAHAKADPASP
jgi:hypothetical protein